ncbi:hypothetical protein ACFLWG_04820 [Chloroflexota bacterium]
MAGLEVSLRHLFQNGIIQGDVGYKLLQPGIFPLDVLYLTSGVIQGYIPG